jgi:hypothetical protein
MAGLGHCVSKIRRRAVGGRAGAAGYSYEDFFSVSLLLTALRNHRRSPPPNCRVRRGAFALVDDVIAKNGQIRFHQLRRRQQVYWEQVRVDFEQQELLCRRVGMSAQLFLVVASRGLRRRLATRMPKSLRRSSVLFFPPLSRVTDLANPTAPSFAPLVALCAAATPGTADLTDLARAVWGFWGDRNTMKFVRADRLLAYLRGKAPLRVWSPFVPGPRWAVVRRRLARIPGLRVTLQGGHLWYRYRTTDRGHICKCGTPAYRRFLDRVMTHRPNSFDAFEVLLP